MKRIKDRHHRAMEFVDSATFARMEGNTEQADQFLRKAYQLEREAANLCAGKLTLEPTRSVLHRSAASLALECKEFREAERLIAAALAGEPPEDIAEELRDLLEQVHFERHLQLRGITLEQDELQLSLAGKMVGLGMVLTEEFVGRVQAFERLVLRTAERRSGIQYRENAAAPKEVREQFEVFMSVPRAASFAVSLRIGRPERSQWLPGFEMVSVSDVVDDIMSGLEDVNQGNEQVLHERIREEPYYRNFVGLARKLAPDGSEVRSVGLTLFRNHRTVGVTLTTRRNQLPSPRLPRTTQEAITVCGMLLFADARAERAGEIRLVDESGVEHKVIVPEGMMSDIVRPLWDSVVIVEGTLTKKGIYLEDIQKADTADASETSS